MHRGLAFTIAFSLLSASGALVGAGCSEAKPAPLAATGNLDGGADAAVTVPLAEPATPCSDAPDSIYQDPGAEPYDPAKRGDILKCSKDADLPKEALQAALTAIGYAGKPITSGARVYKLLYRTQRGDPAGTAGYSSAVAYVPMVQRAAKLPIVVAARGSRGQAAHCAVTKFDASLKDINDDAYRLVYPLVGNGYAVILPDLAGYAGFGALQNPPSAYAQALDVGRGTLDGSRALKRLYPQLDDTTVLVGHSQGGHSALAALAVAESYGAQGPIAGVAVYAPLWLSQRSWGAIIDDVIARGRDYRFLAPGYADPSAVSVWYHYTQAELLDGPGEGIKLFKPEKQAAVKQFIEGSCWGEYKPLEDNATFALDLYDDAFRASVSGPATGAFGPCTAGDAVCTKWLGRYSADRPHLTGKAATTPILVMYGGTDTTIPPERMSCGVDRLKQDGAKLTVCYEGAADHHSIVNLRGEYVGDWIASLTLGTAAPAACAVNETGITKTCDPIPPND
jgi:pimeloyl-ACP methyl ester carboxylesterase